MLLNGCHCQSPVKGFYVVDGFSNTRCLVRTLERVTVGFAISVLLKGNTESSNHDSAFKYCITYVVRRNITIFREETTPAFAGFVEGGKPENPEKNLGARREPTTNSTRIWDRAGIEPRPHL